MAEFKAPTVAGGALFALTRSATAADLSRPRPRSNRRRPPRPNSTFGVCAKRT
ncbi:MAG: hypothetical protein ABR878_09685 [Roseiarcus sp.]|jgi:hypothetical protein